MEPLNNDTESVQDLIVYPIMEQVQLFIDELDNE